MTLIKVVAQKLSLQQGKVLRYTVSRGSNPSGPKSVMNKIAWSDLPHSLLESKKCFADLERQGLIIKVSKGYLATDVGKKVLAHADRKKMWRQPPPPDVVNKTRR